jgi:hypothetical protein
LCREGRVLAAQMNHTTANIRDTQLLRLTDEMQDYIRNGEKQNSISEAVILEKRLQFNREVSACLLSNNVRYTRLALTNIGA